MRIIKGWLDDSLVGEQARYQQSKSGVWHVIGSSFDGLRNLPICQSYNLDRPNHLQGEIVTELPEGARLCRKCATHLA